MTDGLLKSDGWPLPLPSQPYDRSNTQAPRVELVLYCLRGNPRDARIFFNR